MYALHWGIMVKGKYKEGKLSQSDSKIGNELITYREF